MKKNQILNQLACPIPKSRYSRILLAHGSGGQLTRQLIANTIVPALDNPFLHSLQDSAAIATPSGNIAFTTDAYVVSPPLFPRRQHW